MESVESVGELGHQVVRRMRRALRYPTKAANWRTRSLPAGLMRLYSLSVQHQLPNDADGDSLRRLIADGSDLSKPMTVDFQIAVPDEAGAKALAAVVHKLGYRVKIYPSPECSLPWTCECSSRMLASHEAITAIQSELTSLAQPFKGYPDGWGSFGNES